MKQALKILITLSILITYFTSCTNDKDLLSPNLVPVYSVQIKAASSADEVVETGHTAITLPASMNIYKEKDLVIHYNSVDNVSDVEGFKVMSNTESTIFVPNATDVNLPGEEATLVINYSISKDDVVEIEDDAITKTVKESTEYVINLKTTDEFGVAVTSDYTDVEALTILNVIVETTIKEKQDTDVNVAETVTSLATSSQGEVKTEIIVEGDVTTTIKTTTSKALCLITLTETEVYN